MTDSTAWRELHRSSDPREVVAVVTSIASMEFDVRCTTPDGDPITLSEFSEHPAMVIIEVPEAYHRELLDVLEDIIAEQDEFDEMLESRDVWTGKRLFLTLAAIAGVALMIWLAFLPRG